MNFEPNFELAAMLFFLALIALYVFAAIYSGRLYRRWPKKRIILWLMGVICAASTIIGPIAERSHTDFTVHMVGHLLLGMLAPLLLVLAAPMTLIFRCLPVNSARNLTRWLKRFPLRWLTHPIFASILNIGGLWLLYRSELFMMMHHHPLLYYLIHFHVFAAGYLFTASMIYIDPTPHRFSFIYRTVVFIFALFGHGILSKLIYAHPPNGVSVIQAQQGAMLMYYGGDLIEFVIIMILFAQWYKKVRPRRNLMYSRAR